MKKCYKNLLCFAIICALCVFSVPALALEADVSSSLVTEEHQEVEPYGIEEAFECGILTDEDAALIVERRNKYYEMINKIINGEA